MKLVKRLRDIAGHTTITSYYIKTIFLWVNERCGPTFWDGALSDVFLTMLRIYIRYLRSGRIPYFWNYGLNLLDIDPTTLSDITRRLLDISTSIESNRYSNPQLVCKYLGCEMVRLLDRTIVVCIESPLFSSSFI